MRDFTDNLNNKWEIKLTLGSAMRVLEKLGVNLLEIEKGEPSLMTQLGTDEILLGNVLFVLLEKQISKSGFREEDIREAFEGDVLLRAQEAFYAELIDFFRSRGRTDRVKMVQKQRAMIEAAVKEVEKEIDMTDVNAEVGKAMVEAREKAKKDRKKKIDGETSGNSLETSE